VCGVDVATIAIALLFIMLIFFQFNMIELLKGTEILQRRKIMKVDEEIQNFRFRSLS
jgi:hypothetical protein